MYRMQTTSGFLTNAFVVCRNRISHRCMIMEITAAFAYRLSTKSDQNEKTTGTMSLFFAKQITGIISQYFHLLTNIATATSATALGKLGSIGICRFRVTGFGFGAFRVRVKVYSIEDNQIAYHHVILMG